ncbi:MAG TPA: hypothetical protein VGM25_01305 [Caulobacteraceae bacterium]|jgi:hypothetical protein
MTISDKEMNALQNLADKLAGKDVDWINIGDARALTELGFARRNRGGWEITPEGLALLKAPAAGPVLVAWSDTVNAEAARESANEEE